MTEQALPQETRRRRSLGLSILALLSVLGFCLWLGCQEVPQQLQRLPDGSTVRLLGVTYPQKPEMQSGPPLLRLASPFMSSELREQLGLAEWPPFPAVGAYPNPLTLWIRFSDDVMLDSAIPRLNGVVRAWDENGNCAVSRVGALDHFDYSPVFPIHLDSFPRRGKQLRVELFGEDDGGRVQHLATFRLNNPMYRQHPIWHPSAFPNEQRDGSFSATLVELETGLPNPGSGPDIRRQELMDSGDWVYTRAVFILRENGRPTENWTATMATVRDATGNDTTIDTLEDERTPQRLVVRFPLNLWDEPAWKLMLTFGNGSERREATFLVKPTIH